MVFLLSHVSNLAILPKWTWYLPFHKRIFMEDALPFCLVVASYAWLGVLDRFDLAWPALSGCRLAGQMICSHSRKMCNPRKGEKRKERTFWKGYGLAASTQRMFHFVLWFISHHITWTQGKIENKWKKVSLTSLIHSLPQKYDFLTSNSLWIPMVGLLS